MKIKDVWSKLAYSLTNTVRYYNIPIFKDESDKCTVIIESRKLPHLEFVLRKHYHHLDESWSALFVCTKNNEEYVRNLLAVLGNNVQLLVWPEEISTLGDYNHLMLNKGFWKKITAKKVLFFQEDGFLLRDGIESFLEYDYIGAPWPLWWKQSETGIGNGGFSLRNVSLIKTCLNLFSIEKVTEEFLETSQKKDSLVDGILAEDVYFSRCFDKISGVRLPTREIAFKFSCETTKYEGSTGFHGLWNGDDTWPRVIVESIKPLPSIQLVGQTYGQFANIVTSLSSNKDHQICLSHVFNNEKPISPWIGFVHSFENLTYMGLSSSCKGLITFSEHSKVYLNSIDSSIPVLVVPFPLNQSSMKEFILDDFLLDDIVLINVNEKESYNIPLLECILSNTPVLVNRCLLSEEYLGQDYPLFDSEQKSLSLEDIKLAYDYLKNNIKLKMRLSTDYFLRCLINSDFWDMLSEKKNKDQSLDKKVIILNEYMGTFGGGERSTLAYALAFKTLGFSAKILSTIPISSEKIVECFGVDFSEIPIEYYPCKSFSKIISELKPDIFVNHSYANHVENPGRKGIYVLMFPCFNNTLTNMKTYDLILSISGFTKQHVDMVLPLNKEKNFILHPPIQNAYVNMATDLLKTNIKKNKSFVSVGRFFRDNHCKNHKIIIEEFINATKEEKEFNNWELHLIGNVNDKEYFEECLIEAKGQPNIHFHTNLSNQELSNILYSSCFYVHAGGLKSKGPEHCEHFGLSIIEAMAHGCIPIVFNRGGIFDILDISKEMGFSYSSPLELKKCMIYAATILWVDKIKLSCSQKLCLSSIHLVSQESFTKKLNLLLLTLV